MRHTWVKCYDDIWKDRVRFAVCLLTAVHTLASNTAFLKSLRHLEAGDTRSSSGFVKTTRRRRVNAKNIVDQSVLPSYDSKAQAAARKHQQFELNRVAKEHETAQKATFLCFSANTMNRMTHEEAKKLGIDLVLGESQQSQPWWKIMSEIEQIPGLAECMVEHSFSFNSEGLMVTSVTSFQSASIDGAQLGLLENSFSGDSLPTFTQSTSEFMIALGK